MEQRFLSLLEFGNPLLGFSDACKRRSNQRAGARSKQGIICGVRQQSCLASLTDRRCWVPAREKHGRGGAQGRRGPPRQGRRPGIHLGPVCRLSRGLQLTNRKLGQDQ